ncbi:phage/plasmid primase, P4 family [Sandarakinorhabdus sp. AAP62]|uniref:phage/plasmid primase, P4 family n=1 Tax=Sandarakinorhabdus sp. AAP62 TaxID=1248916 RepID=UPI0003679887|nr:phage/plasmid primase, P4 family [Sandarakinorhabdus sp. AAP62]
MSADIIRPFGKRDASARLDDQEISEDLVARHFTNEYGDRLRFCHSSGVWFEWDGVRWKPDTTQMAFNYAREMARSLSNGHRTMCKASAATGVERFARADPVHAVTADHWDRDKWLLGTPAGLIALKTRKSLPPDPSAYITRATGVAPERGTPKKFLEFLHQVTGDDQEVIDFLQRVCGYLLTGDTSEHALFFIYGPGGNGKSVFVNLLQFILGDYGQTAAMDTFTASFGTKHPTDLAMLKGARGVFAIETEAGSSWAEARIKALTGGDKITARFMRQDYFSFTPEFKLVMVGNHAPNLNNVDEAMKRRFYIIPFTRTPAKPDPKLESKLRAEAGKILWWMIQGCSKWQRHGLGRPKAIIDATESYFAEQDVLGQWIADRTERIEGIRHTSSALFASWSDFAKAIGEAPGSIRQFSNDLEKRGYRRKKMMHGRCFVGIQLKQATRRDTG